MSQSMLTSGHPAKDDYMQVALGLRAIGKSVLEMPKTIDDLRLFSKEYMKNLGVMDDLNEEQIYLSYIEDHLNA